MYSLYVFIVTIEYKNKKTGKTHKNIWEKATAKPLKYAMIETLDNLKTNGIIPTKIGMELKQEYFFNIEDTDYQE